MAITYELVAADWTIDSATGNIRYGGHDHNGVSPSYATVIEFHRWLQELADDQYAADVSDELYISMLNPSQRSTDNIITLINGYNIDAAAAEHLYDGSIIQSDGDEIWDGIVNFGNADVQIQIIQDGDVLDDDFWNYNYGGTATGGSTTTLTDTGAFTGLSLDGFTILNVTEGCYGRAASHTDDTITFDTGELHNGTNDDFATSDTYLLGVPLNPNTQQGISHRFMVKVREDGVDIDGRRLVGIARRMGNTYGEFKINGTSRGNNVLALTDSADLNCTSENATVIGATWDSEFSGYDLGFEQFDVNGDGTNEDYYGKLTWTGSHTINDLYEYVKGITEDGSGYTVHGLSGEVLRGINYSFGYDNELGGISITDYDMLVWGTYVDHGAVTSGPFQVGEAVHENIATPTWKGRVLSVDGVDTSLIIDVTFGAVGNGDEILGKTSGATATVSSLPTVVAGGGVLHVLANDATGDILYVQVLKGTMAAENAVLYYGGTDLATADHTDTCDVDSASEAITERTISTPIIGVSTGTAIIGSYGFGIDNLKLASTDKVFDLTNTQITPPNTVTNSVTGLESGEDYVLVAPWDGTTTDANDDPAIDTDQMLIATTALTSAVQGSIEVNAIPGSTPDAGTIRVVNNDGFHVRCVYTGYVDATDIFTINPTVDFSGTGLTANADIGNHAYVSYIDKLAASGTESFAAVYDSDLDLVLLVRDGGGTPIKQHIVEWSFLNNNQSSGVIRTTDT